jgi:hypothetical protein
MHGEHLVYLYCVTAQPPDLTDLNEAQNRSGKLYMVCEAGLFAVVSRVQAGEFGQAGLRRNLDNLGWVAAETTKHERIIETVMRDHCVIPFRFATLFIADEGLRTLLRAHCEEFTALLERLANKGEWGVKAYCDAKKLRDNVCARDGAISGLDETIRSASSGKAFLLRKKREELAKAILLGTTDQYAERIVGALHDVSFQTRINKVLPAEATNGRGAAILNSVFLVGNEDTPRFLDAVAVLNECHAEDGVVVACSGPWPPYHFCDLAKKVMDE